MRHHAFRRALASASVIASLVLVGAGCGKKPAPAPAPAPPTAAQPAPAPAPSPSEPAPAPAPSGAAVSLCANPYFALTNGLRVDYESNAGGKVSTYAMTVSEATSTSAKLTFDFPASKLTFVQAITCLNGSVTTNAFMNMAGVGTMQTETKRVEGELMPKDVRAGSTWSTTYETSVTMTGQAGAKMNMTVSTENKAVGEEQVTVPAGTFTALKVESASTTTLAIEGAPTAMQPTTTTSTQWWVKGIGMVKSTSSNQYGTTTTVATKITR